MTGFTDIHCHILPGLDDGAKDRQMLEQMLEMAYTTDYIGTANNARYSDEEMDSLFDQTRTEEDSEAREALFDQILTKAQEEAVYAVLCNPLTLFAYNSDLNCPEIPFEGLYSVYDFSWGEA